MFCNKFLHFVLRRSEEEKRNSKQALQQCCIQEGPIEEIIKNDIQYFLLNPGNMKKYIINKSSKILNNDFKAIEFENKKDKINKDIDKL
jgi:hypothetical protein